MDDAALRFRARMKPFKTNAMKKTLPKQRSKTKHAKTARRRAAAPARKRIRLDPELRSGQILRGAIAFFAERGFGGQTRELAQQLGISQGLLYRYFPTKESLIEQIYEELFVKRFKPEWDTLLTDRSVPLLDRLTDFYRDYSEMLHDDEWGRIYLYSGLGGSSIARRFATHVTQSIFTRVIDELRHDCGVPGVAGKPMSEPEAELMWGLHGSIFYIGIRKSVYRVEPPRDIAGTVRRMVENFYDNGRELMRVSAS